MSCPRMASCWRSARVATTGTYTANLTYLRRGQYGTAPSAHAIGDQFTVIDVLGSSGTTVAYDLPARYVGVPLYVKFCSTNSFGLATEDISTVAEYQYTPIGTGFGGGAGGIPTVPTGLTATPGNGQNQVAWAANPSTDGVTAYTLYTAPGLGASFGSATAIFTGSATAFTHSGLGNSAPYTYFVSRRTRWAHRPIRPVWVRPPTQPAWGPSHPSGQEPV